MISAEELRKTTDQCKQNIDACNELYIEEVVKSFEKLYKKDIKKIEKGIKQQASKGLYMVIFEKTKLDRLKAMAYKEGITKYFEQFGYEVLVKDNDRCQGIFKKLYTELTIGIKWEGK